MNKQIMIPETQYPLTKKYIWQWYENIPKELSLDFLSDKEKDEVSCYYEEAGLLKSWRRPFFQVHFSNTFTEAAKFLLSGKDSPTIIDIGSGYGTQAIFLALLGARVISVDLDPLSLSIQRKRIAFYEEISQKKLKIDIIEGDSLALDYSALGPFDALYSMFAFNMIQPSSDLLEMILPSMAARSRFVIQDGNASSAVKWIIPSRKRDVLSPQDLSDILIDRQFEIREHKGCVVTPPMFWLILPNGLLEILEAPLRANWLLPISHQILAIKKD